MKALGMKINLKDMERFILRMESILKESLKMAKLKEKEDIFLTMETIFREMFMKIKVMVQGNMWEA